MFCLKYDTHQHQGPHRAMLQSLLDDFVQHNVDTACGLLETAGRFLYRLPETHTRMANMAEVCTLLGPLVTFAGSKADSCTRHCKYVQTLFAAIGKTFLGTGQNLQQCCTSCVPVCHI